MIIDPSQNNVPWSHKLRIGAVLVDLLAPHQAAAIDLSPSAGGTVTEADLRRAVEGLLPAEARPLVASLPAGHLVDVLRQYEACADVWRQTRAEMAGAIAVDETRRGLTPRGPARRGRAVAAEPRAEQGGGQDSPGDEDADVIGQVGAAKKQARAGTRHIELDVTPGEPLPQPLAEMARQTEQAAARSGETEVVEGARA